MIDLIGNPWTVAIGGGLVVGLLLYYVFGIGKNKSNTNSTYQYQPSGKQQQIVDSDNSPIVDRSVSITTINVYDQTFKREEMVEIAPREMGPKPHEIITEIEKAPPYQQPSVAKHYTNITVVWKVRLTSIKEYGDILRVVAFHGDNWLSGTDVSCDVKSLDYPRLKIMRKEEVFYVDGKISEISGKLIELIDTKLIFVDN